MNFVTLYHRVTKLNWSLGYFSKCKSKLHPQTIKIVDMFKTQLTNQRSITRTKDQSKKYGSVVTYLYSVVLKMELSMT